MVCLRNISVGTLHKGDTEVDDDDDIIIIIIIINIIKQGVRVPLKAVSLLLFENITTLVIFLILVNKLLLRDSQ
jgi:hypothetical protein